MNKPDEPEHWRDLVLRVLLPYLGTTASPPVFPITITARDATGRKFGLVYADPDDPRRK